MAHVRLQAIQRQNGPPLARQHAPQPFAARKRGRQQLVVAVEQVGHAALSDLHPPPAQGRVDLRHASMVAVTQSADQATTSSPNSCCGNAIALSSSGRYGLWWRAQPTCSHRRIFSRSRTAPDKVTSVRQFS